MVQTVTIPLSFANNIPGVSGIRDVTFQVPQVGDIEDAVDDIVPALDDIADEVDDIIRDALQDVDVLGEQADRLVDDIVEELEDALNVDFPDLADIVNQVGQEVEDRIGDIGTVEVDGGLFSVETDLVDIIAGALDAADLFGISEFPTIAEIEEMLADATADLDELDIPGIDDIQDAVEDAIDNVLGDSGIADLVDDPVTVLTTAVLDAIDEAVDTTTADDLQADAESDRPWD